MNNHKLLLWINQSNGDTLGTIPLITQLLSKYPDIEIVFSCFSSQSYLVSHLPIKVLPIDGNYTNMYLRSQLSIFTRKFKPYIEDGFTSIHLWLGNYNLVHTWKNQVITFNNQCKQNNLDIFLDDSDFGYIELPKNTIEVKNNSIYVENSNTVSGQTFFHYDVSKYSMMFPNLNFYTTGPVERQAKNIFDCSKMDLVGLSNVSRKCNIILGKGSGPFFCTMNEENKSKLKILSGLREGYRVKFWNDNDENCHLVDSETEVLNILRMENKKIVKL